MDTLVRAIARRGKSVGMESQGGSIRRDSSGVRVWSGHDRRRCQEAEGSSSNGPRGDRKRITEAAKTDQPVALEIAACNPVYRSDFGGRSESAPETATHGASD